MIDTRQYLDSKNRENDSYRPTLTISALNFEYWIICTLALFLLSIAFGSGVIVVVGVVGMAIFTVCARGLSKEDCRKFTVFTILAIVAMLVVYIGMIQKYGEPYYGGDDKMFEDNGEQLYRSGIFTFSGVPYIYRMTYAKGYLTILSWVYKLSAVFGGYTTIAPRLLNIFLWLSTVVLVYKKVLLSLDNTYFVKKALPFFSLYPNAIFMASCVYRDIVVTFLFTVFVLSFEQFVDTVRNGKLRSKHLLQIIPVCVSIYVLSYIRPQMVYVSLVIGVLYLVWGKFDFSFWNKFLLFLMALIVASVVFSYSGGSKLLSLIMDSYSDYRIIVNDGMAGRIFSMSLMPFGIIFRFFYGFACPFPGGVLSLNYFSEPIFSLIMLMVYCGTICQIFLMPYILRGTIKLDYSTFRFLVIYSAIIITTYTFRHFVMTYPLAFMAICNQKEQVSQKKQNNIRNIMLVLIAVMVVAYMFLKII